MSAALFEPNQIAALEMRDFLGRFLSTGTPVLDMIIGMLVFRLILYVTSLAESPMHWALPQWLLNLLFPAAPSCHSGQLEFEISDINGGNLSQPTGDLSPGYKGIVHKLSQIEDERLWRLRETRLTTYNSNLGRYCNEMLYDVNQPEPIEVVPGVFVQANDSETVRPTQKGGHSRTLTRRLVLYSDILDPPALRELVDKWADEYDEHKTLSLQDKSIIFQVRFGALGKQETNFTEFHTFRCFDNLHFAHKNTVLRELDFFMNSKAWYEERGLPYTLGILCYGEPGCGKTSFIKAVLKYTKRHAVVFSINRHTNLEAIERMMRTDHLENLPIPQEHRIYILEDVDAMGDLVRKRKEEEPIGPRPLHEEALAYMGMGKNSRKQKNKKKGNEDDGSDESGDDLLDELLSTGSKKSHNNLSFLLNILDGVVENPGRIVIMTTNYVDKLDPALIRPGRIDLKLEFGRCTRDLLQQILGQFYDVPESAVELPPQVEDDLVTPARVAQMCRGNKKSLSAMLVELAEECRKQKEKKEAPMPELTLWDKLNKLPECKLVNKSMLVQDPPQPIHSKLFDESNSSRLQPFSLNVIR